MGTPRGGQPLAVPPLDADNGELAKICAAIEQSELEQRRRRAADLRNYFLLLLTLARESQPALAAEDLTAHRVQTVANGKLLRKAANTLAQLKGISEAQARRLLRISVQLHQHGRPLLDKLAAGRISFHMAAEAAHQLASLTAPQQGHTPPDEPRSQSVDEAESTEVADAKERLAAELNRAATTDVTDAEFVATARQLREQHHPASAPQRRQAAQHKRHVKVHEASDGMSTLTAFIPTTTAQQIMHRLHGLAEASHKKSRADLTKNQIVADLLAEALLGNRHAGSESGGIRTGKVSVLLMLDLADAIGLGACIAPGQLTYLRDKYPELYEQAEHNRRALGSNAATGREAAGKTRKVLTRELMSGTELDAQAAAEHFLRAEYLRAVVTDPISGYPIGAGGQLSPATRAPRVGVSA